MPGTISRRSVGSRDEELACLYLEKQGYRIRMRNFRCRSGEIDIVASDGRDLVFVEVKYRADAAGGGPLAAVGYAKQKKISRCARFYLMRYGYPEDTPCRFDVVGITGREVELVRDAFPFRE